MNSIFDARIPILLLSILFLVQSCANEKFKGELADLEYPLNECTDFSPPAAPAGAKTVSLLIVRIEFDGEQKPYNFFQSNACTWAKKIFYNSSQGQLNHYFNSVSSNAFHLVPAIESHQNDGTADGIITVSLEGEHPNPQAYGHFHSQLVDAITKADPYIDFSLYDISNDGIIHGSDLQVIFLVAGFESATTPNDSYPGIWAHNWYINDQEGVSAPVLDGKTVLGYPGNGYSRFGEMQTTRGYDATIGVIAHELGHAIWRLPDLYDIDGSSAGIGDFGLMGSGSWGLTQGEHHGETPVEPTAWTKEYLGWVIPFSPLSGSSITLTATGLSGYNVARRDISASEYFLIENRGTTGYDAGLYYLEDIESNASFQGGISIWHIDTSVYNNSREYRKLVDLEEAEDEGLDYGLHYGRTKNLFWDTNQDTFGPSTTPNTNTNWGVVTTTTITNISARGPVMRLDIAY